MSSRWFVGTMWLIAAISGWSCGGTPKPDRPPFTIAEVERAALAAGGADGDVVVLHGGTVTMPREEYVRQLNVLEAALNQEGQSLRDPNAEALIGEGFWLQLILRGMDGAGELVASELVPVGGAVLSVSSV